MRVYLNSSIEVKTYDQLKEKIKELSKGMPGVIWILYRLNESPWRRDLYSIAFSPEDQADIWWYMFISGAC